MNNSSSLPSNPIEGVPAVCPEASLELSDEALVALAQKNDKTAFSQLIKRYQNPVYAILYNLTQKAELADDLTQQSFVKVWRALDKFEGRSSFATWIYRIAHNTFYDFKRKYEPEMIDIQGEHFQEWESQSQKTAHSPIELLEKKEQKALLKEALKHISLEQKTALLLKEVHGHSYKEIAEITGVSVGTVMSRIHYARQNLRLLLQDYED